MKTNSQFLKFTVRPGKENKSENEKNTHTVIDRFAETNRKK